MERDRVYIMVLETSQVLQVVGVTVIKTWRIPSTRCVCVCFKAVVDQNRRYGKMILNELEENPITMNKWF